MATDPDVSRMPVPRRSVRTPGPAEGIAVFAVAATLLVTASAGMLFLDNVDGPMPDHPGLGALAGVGCGVVVATVVAGVLWMALRRSRVLALVIACAVCITCWVLLPRQVDRSESFVPQPNARWECTGWSFQHYPPDVMDADSQTYCVGLEKRIADG